MISIQHIVGIAILLLAVLIGLYLRFTPARIPIRFRFGKNPEFEQPFKFVNEAPVAPEMTTATSDAISTSQEIVQHHNPMTNFTRSSEHAYEPSTFEEEVTNLIEFFANAVRVQGVDKNTLLILKRSRVVGLAHCIKTKRVTNTHIQALIDGCKRYRVKTGYIVTTGKLDRLAQRIAISNNLHIINGEKLKTLRQRYEDAQTMMQFEKSKILD